MTGVQTCALPILTKDERYQIMLRCPILPEYHELREAFGQSSSKDLDDLDAALKKYDFFAHSVRHKVKVLG